MSFDLLTLPFGLSFRFSVTSSGHKLSAKQANIQFNKEVNAMLRTIPISQLEYLKIIDERIRRAILDNYQRGKGRGWSSSYKAWRNLQAELGNPFATGTKKGEYTGQFGLELNKFFRMPGKITKDSKNKMTLSISVPQRGHLGLIWYNRQIGFPVGHPTGIVSADKLVMIPFNYNKSAIQRAQTKFVRGLQQRTIISKGTDYRHTVPILPSPLISNSEINTIVLRVSKELVSSIT